VGCPVSADYIREHYRVPAGLDGRIRYTGGKTPQHGTIVGFYDAHLRIRLDGERSIGHYHPTWEIKYLHSATCQESGSGPCPVCAYALETLALEAGEAS
jgi:hypothetical protein